MSEASDRVVEDTKHALHTRNLPYKFIQSGRELKKEYPNLEYPDNYRFLIDYNGGLLYADRALRAFQASSTRCSSPYIECIYVFWF